jgi:hypothetical protein
VKRQMYVIGQLSTQWRAVLHTRIYRTCMGHLLTVVLSDLLERMKRRVSCLPL